MPSEEVTHPIAEEAASIAGQRELINRMTRLLEQRGILVAVRGDVDTNFLAAQGSGGIAGIFQGFPNALKQQALAWVHQFSLTWRDAEERRIELVNVCDEARPIDRCDILLARRIAIVGAPVPSLARDDLDAMPPFHQVVPECVDPLGAGHAAVDADDGELAERRLPGVHRHRSTGIVQRLGVRRVGLPERRGWGLPFNPEAL